MEKLRNAFKKSADNPLYVSCVLITLLSLVVYRFTHWTALFFLVTAGFISMIAIISYHIIKEYKNE